jgi:hypothetical protein
LGMYHGCRRGYSAAGVVLHSPLGVAMNREIS